MQSCPAGSASNALKKLDGDERDEWVHRHRMAEEIPLGKLVRLIMDENVKLWKPVSHGGGTQKHVEAGTPPGKTEKHWKEQVAALKTQNANLKRKPPGGQQTQQPPKKPRTGDKKTGNPVTLKLMLNGTAICDGYNKGTCNGTCSRNPPELHVCNGKTKNGKKDVACGRKHKSTECTICLQKS